MPTVEQLFTQLNIPLWWKTPTQLFNGGSEKGTDYSLGAMNQPVGSLTKGTVVYVGDGGLPGSSVGQIVQIRTNDGALLHYQHLKVAKVHTGQAVSTGDIIGLGGGCPVGGYFADNSRNDCKFYDAYSTGQHIEVRYSPSYSAAGGVWNQNWLNPAAIFTNLAGKPAGGNTNSPVGGAGQVSSGAGGGSLPFALWGSKVGLFVLALVILSFGLYLLFQRQVNAAVRGGAKTAVKAAAIA